MKALFWTLVLIAVIFILAVFTPLFIVRTINVDKNSYLSGDEVSINYTIKGFGMLCTCQGPVLEIYRLENGGWEKVLFDDELNFIPNYECDNGILRRSSIFGCDLVMCNFQFINELTEYVWDMNVFEGEEKTCGNQTYTDYEEVDAPDGKYKVKYGMAEAFFSIL